MYKFAFNDNFFLFNRGKKFFVFTCYFILLSIEKSEFLYNYENKIMEMTRNNQFKMLGSQQNHVPSEK